MHEYRVAENVVGTIGTICWTIQLLPQIWKSWRTKSTEGLSPFLVFNWALSSPFFGVYAIVQNLNIPLILQPQLFGVLSLVSWAQCLYYQKGWSKVASFSAWLSATILLGGLQVGMVYAVRPSFDKGDDRPIEAFGIVSSILVFIAIIPQYREIWKYKEVIGISVTFMAIDALGGIFSDLSLAFKSSFEIIPAVTYTMIIVTDLGIVIAALILNPRARRRRSPQHVQSADGVELGPVHPEITASPVQ